MTMATLGMAAELARDGIAANTLWPATTIAMLLPTTYAPTAAYGHFGRTDIDLPWEHTNKAAELKAAAGA